MSVTRIEWADAVWNPVTGCTKVSPGCKHCYAERFARRLAGRFGYPEDEPFKVTLHQERLNEPLHWRNPRRIFVGSMTDLMHPDIPRYFVEEILRVIDSTPQHTYLLLTKRPERLEEQLYGFCEEYPSRLLGEGDYLENLWIGVSVESQYYAEQRIPLLLRTPAAVRFVSLEPLLGPIDLRPYLACPKCHGKGYHHGFGEDGHDPDWCTRCGGIGGPGDLHWVIAGSESGPGARPMDEAWVRSIRDQCSAAGVPFFYKQRLDEHGRKITLPELDGQRWVGVPHDA